jgi:type I restriction enzyme S subunit
MGTSPKGETYNRDGIGLPLLNGPTEFGNFHPSCTLFTTDSKRECKPGDLIFCVRGSTTGRMNWADQVYSLGRGVCAIRGRTYLETRFVKYCLAHKLPALLAVAGGGTFPNLTKDDIYGFRIPFPEARTRIATVLSAYDDLIENNNRRIAILEEMARLLYREWFVHFRFPGHEQVRMVGSDLGPIPEGWEVRSLGDVSLNFDRLRIPLSSRERTDMKGEYPYYGAARVLDHIDDYIFDGIYLLVAEDGSVITEDRKPVLQIATGKFWVNNHAHVLQGKPPLSTYFLYLDLSRSDVSGFITGAAQPKINQANLNRIPVILPPTSLLDQFDQVIDSFFAEIDILATETATLASSRDLILPHLISGRLDVSDLDIDTTRLEV